MKIFSPILKGTTTVAQGTTNLSGSFTGSLLGTAATASYADNFTVGGTLTAQTINVQIITSSIEFNTGSTRNGSSTANTHQFTGSVLMTGSLSVTGSAAFSSDVLLPYSKALAFNSISNQYITADASNLVLGTANFARLIITSAGNVGIGTTDVVTRLSVASNTDSTWGNLSLFDTRSATAGVGGALTFNGYKISTTNGAIFAKIAGFKENSTSGNEEGTLAFYTTNPSAVVTERMRINSSGTVYINATSGGYSTPRLYIDNGATTSVGVVIVSDNAGRLARFNNRDYNDTNTGSSIRFGLGSGTGNTYAVINAYQAGESTTSNLILNQSGGNVGIGLSDPLGRLSTLGGAVQIMGDYVNHQTIIKSAGTAGTYSGELTITIPQMSNASSDGYGGYSCEVYLSAYEGKFCHVWFSGYNNGGITGGEVTILRSSGGFSASQSSTGANNQGFIFVVNYPVTTVHPAARIIFNKGGSVTSTAHPANSITAIFS